MEISKQREMRETYADLSTAVNLSEWRLFVFGYTDATGCLIDMVKENGYAIAGILDNNPAKQGTCLEGVPVIPPQDLCRNATESVMVFITSRAYATMLLQLKELGFRGRVVKLVEYDTFAEYDLSPDVINKKLEREHRGNVTLARLNKEAGGKFIIICPFKAVGDVYYAMKYLSAFRQKHSLGSIAVAVVEDSCLEAVKIFYDVPILSLRQAEMDELVQAVLFRQPGNVLIVHHDRPYTNYLIRLLRKQLLPFGRFYKVGIYGLLEEVAGEKPRFWQDWVCEKMPQGRSAVLMPYAKSVVNLPVGRWEDIVKVLKAKGYAVFSFVQGNEVPLAGTRTLRDVPISAMKGIVEQAGCFISIRNGLCDILQEAECKKILLYPDACYSDTPWQVVEFFNLSGCSNVIFKNDGSWELYDGGGNRPFDFAQDLDF